MGVKSKIKSLLINCLDKIIIFRKEQSEIRKFKDKRRKDIYKKVLLSKEQKRELNNLYKLNYGKKIPYTWHRHFTAFTGTYDKYYFPELLFVPDFEYFMNMDESYCKVFADKNVLPSIANDIGVKTPKVILTCVESIYKDSENNCISKSEAISKIKNIGKCFAKPTVDTCSGIGCRILDVVDGKDILSDQNIENIFKELGNNFVVQKCIMCHESILNLYSKSVNTFRIITYRWKDELLHVPCTMRIGQGGNYLDNAHAGGMFIAVKDDGTLHKTAFTEFKNEYNVHPDTSVQFENYKIDLFPKVLETAKKMHTMIPQMGIVHWDFTIDESGEPLLIEANLRNGGIWIAEMAHGKAPFGDLTPEILRWIRFMKKTKVQDRKKYKFGKI